MTIGFFALVGMGVPLLPWLNGSETLWGRRVLVPDLNAVSNRWSLG